MIAPRLAASPDPEGAGGSPPERRAARRSAAVVAAAAGITLRGFLREPILPAALAALAATLLAGTLLSGATLDGEGRLARHLGAAAAGLLGWALALAHGSGLTGRGGALDRASLAAPVPAALLLAGRFLGLAAGLVVWAALSSGVLALGTALVGGGAAPERLLALLGFAGFLALRLLVVLALALLFSTLLPPASAAILAGSAALAGFLPTAIETTGWSGYRLARALLPDFSRLDPPVSGEIFLPFGLHALLYAALYAGAALAAALALFPGRRRAGRG